MTGGERVENVLRSANGELVSMDASVVKRKAEEQWSITKSSEDLRVLTKAMKSFTGLQHVKILRLQDEADRQFLDFIQENETPLIDLKWPPACAHATKTIGKALVQARSPFSRFSGPMMNIQSARALRERVPSTVPMLAARLVGLELHFEDGLVEMGRMREVSALFKTVFHAAKNLQAIHIGFPSRSPVDFELERLFHGICWEKLRVFGIQSWRLDGEEIIELARRHSKTLKGLRLRDVQLKEGSMWKDVLAFLRTEMEQLDWVSLRRIDYSDHFDELWTHSFEVFDDDLANASDSENDDFSLQLNGNEDSGSDEENSDQNSEADSDQGPEANDIDLPTERSRPLAFCTCSQPSYSATADDLGDNGRHVSYQQRKMWEKWVVGRCPEHGEN